MIALYTAASAALLAAALIYLKQEAVRSGERLTESFAQVIGEQTSRTLQAVDDRLNRASQRLQALRATGHLNEASGRRMLTEELKGLPFVRAMWVLDREGRVALDADGATIGLALADSSYFQAHRDHPGTGFLLSPLARSRLSGGWLISASRPLSAPGEPFEGVIVAAVEPPYFEGIWRDIELGKDGAVTLFSRAGHLMIRNPPDNAAMGKDFSGQALFARHLPAKSQGVFVSNSSIDGRERLAAYRVLQSYPELVVVVGTGYSELLAPWRRFAILTIFVWLLAVFIAGGLALQLRNQSFRRERNELRFRELAQAMPQIVFIADGAGEVRFLNELWVERTGHPPEAASGRGWLDFVHPDDIDATQRHLASTVEAGGELQHEYRLRHGDGAFRWQLLRASPARDARGQVIAWYGTSTDIDELKQAQNQLTQQTELLSMAGRLARMGSWVVDPHAQQITWSEEAAAILDLPSGTRPAVEEVLAMMTPGSRKLALDAIGACAAEGTPFDVEVEMTTPAGRVIWVRSIGQAVRDGEGRIIRLEGAQQDITERVRLVSHIKGLNAGLEQKVAARTHALRLANEQLQSFAHSVSHDLQSPLQRVASFTHLLQEETQAAPGSRALHFLTRIRANTDHMTELINGLLAMAQVSEMQMVRAPVDLSTLAREILDHLQGEDPGRSVVCRVQPGLSAIADVRLMRSVLENLLGNAWKFTSKTAGAEVSFGGVNERGEFFVRDNGAGFDMAYADKLFGTFQRLHGAEFPGSGIGLGTVARAISRQGGRVWAHGETERGAAFYFTLPILRHQA